MTAFDKKTGPEPSLEEPDLTARAALMEALFREHNQGLVRFLAARLSSDQEAREVAQEAYVRLLQLDQPQAVGFLRAFLFKTASNIATDHLRRRRLTRAAQAAEAFGFDVDHRGPDDYASGDEEVRIVAACLDELTPRCRQAVLLSRVNGMTSSEIAAQLGVTTRMVRMYIAEALVLIRARLEQAHAYRAPGNPRESGS
jgi:RNA polymerase sigma factor (sigma-70 family)